VGITLPSRSKGGRGVKLTAQICLQLRLRIVGAICLLLLHVFMTWEGQICIVTIFPVAQQSLLGQGLLIIEASRSHSDTQHSIGLLWTGGQPDGETCTLKHTTITREREISMSPSIFEPANPASERPQTHALHRAATGIGCYILP
jgi:hypothetical protein